MSKTPPAPPEFLLQTIAAPLRDLTAAAGLPAEVEAVAGEDGSLWRLQARFSDGFTAGFEVLLDPNLDVAVASGLQEAYIEHLGAAVPPCPGHPHPLAPRRAGPLVGWFCPADGRWQMAFGSFDPGAKPAGR